jgi:hypothetical protein
MNSFSIDINVDNNSGIKSIDAYVFFMDDSQEIRELIIEYLAYAGTIPYKNSDPDLARKWIRDNAQIHGSKTEIGNIWFSINRENSWNLYISPVEPTIEALSEQRLEEIREEDAALIRYESDDDKILIEIEEIDDNVSTAIIPEQEENYLYFSYKVKMTNNTGHEIVLEPRWMVFTVDNHVYMTGEDTCYARKPALDGKIPPEESKEGWITFRTDSRAFFLESKQRGFIGDLRPLFIE